MAPPADVRVGDRIRLYWRAEGEWYSGKVLRVGCEVNGQISSLQGGAGDDGSVQQAEVSEDGTLVPLPPVLSPPLATASFFLAPAFF